MNIFSQVLKKDNIDYMYECSITEEDSILFTHGISNDKIIVGMIDSITIDYQTLRNFMTIELCELIKYNYRDYVSDTIVIKHESDKFGLYSKMDISKISLPKTFMAESYQILKTMWVED